MSEPRSITIIRHAEKPTPQNGDRGVNIHGHHREDSLSPLGWVRAGAITARFSRAHPPEPFRRPTKLYAAGYPDNPDGTKHRARETITPLAQRLGLEINTPFLISQGVELAGQLLTDSDHDVLACWRHEDIPPILEELSHRLRIAEPPPFSAGWPDDDFDTAVVFRRTPDGWTVEQTSEHLLAGD